MGPGSRGVIPLGTVHIIFQGSPLGSEELGGSIRHWSGMAPGISTVRTRRKSGFRQPAGCLQVLAVGEKAGGVPVHTDMERGPEGLGEHPKVTGCWELAHVKQSPNRWPRLQGEAEAAGAPRIHVQGSARVPREERRLENRLQAEDALGWRVGWTL